jgi:hypothetical protein
MAKDKKGRKITLVGGRRATELNPLELVRQYKAVCVTEHVVVSTTWRSTQAEALEDAAEHIENGHFIDFDTRIVGQ